MRKKLLFNEKHLAITLRRLCAELVERNQDLAGTILLGLQPRGRFLAQRIRSYLHMLGHNPHLGELDTTFYRDDFRKNAKIRVPYPTRLDGSIEGKHIVLIDDVLYTGRSVRAAMDALLAHGRPKRIELLVLIDRVDSRDMPIEANYVGCRAHTLHNQHISLSLHEQGEHKKDGIWITQKKNMP